MHLCVFDVLAENAKTISYLALCETKTMRNSGVRSTDCK